MKHCTMLAVGLSLLGLQAFAGGYQVAIQGQRQIGMGHTGTALAWDASSIFFNPGSLAFTKKNNVMVGGSLIRSRVRYVAEQETYAPSNYATTTNSPFGTPFTLYASYGVESLPKLKFGLGVYTPYGSTVSWEDDWKGYSVLRSLKLSSIFIQPTVSYRITDEISLGAGFVYAVGNVNLKKGIGAISGTDGYASAELKGGAYGMGFNAGIHVQATDKVSIGLSYRSQVDMEVEGGDATFTAPASVYSLGIFPSGGTKFDAVLPLPAVANLGVGYQIDSKWTVAVDVNYTFWSAYKELRFDYEKPVNGSTSTVSQRQYINVPTVRLGAEYKPTESFAIRAGYYFDKSPVQEGYMTPETPDANRNGYTLGLGYKINEKLSVDASVLLIDGVKRNQSQGSVNAADTRGDVLAGTYKTRAFCPGLSVSYNF